MDYTTLSLSQVQTGLADVARDAQETFGHLDPEQLNWRPDAAKWSVAQCFDHLLTTNAMIISGARHALGDGRKTIWQRMPMLPRIYGKLLIRSQAPSTSRKFVAPRKARPATSEIDSNVIGRFVEQHREAVDWIQTLDDRDTARAIMISPFAGVVTYSVLDGLRLFVAHDRRHVEQARRVMSSAVFPSAHAR